MSYICMQAELTKGKDDQKVHVNEKLSHNLYQSCRTPALSILQIGGQSVMTCYYSSWCAIDIKRPPIRF